MDGKNYLDLTKLHVYILSREYSKTAWGVYEKLSWQIRKIIGDQFITSIDSIGANIAEGYGRFHYLDKNKFYYNARGSLVESKHWCGLMKERKIIIESQFVRFKDLNDDIYFKLNSLIKSQFNQKK